MRLKELLLLLFFVVSAECIFPQMPPAWYDNDLRRLEYNDDEYFTGFAEGTPMDNEQLETATKRLKDAARVEALSTIRVHVKNNTTNNALSETLHTMDGTFRQSSREFVSSTTTSVDMEIPGLQIEAWQDPNTGNIAAFAYVKKSTLIRQLEKKITVALTKIEMSLDQVEQLIETGQKLQARSIAEKAVPQMNEIGETQKILVAVDVDASDETLQLAETKIYQQRLTSIIAQLKNGLNIYIQANAKIFSSDYSALKAALQGHLSKLGCSFVANEADSDWTIIIDASAREYSVVSTGSVKSYFTYVDANIAVIKTVTAQRIYENMISEKGGHTHNYEQAARDAYKYLTPKICAIVEEQIKQ